MSIGIARSEQAACQSDVLAIARLASAVDACLSALGTRRPAVGTENFRWQAIASVIETGMRIKCAALLISAALLRCVPAQTTKPPGGFPHEFLLSFDDVQTKVLTLAKAIPADKFSWRPGAGVRSVSEVYVHIANGNRLLLALMNGMPAREEFMKMVQTNEQRERTVTGKAKIVADLEASFKEVHDALDSASGDQLSKPIKFFGEDATPRAVYMTILSHVSEHLGQSIAYARMNGIVPPWSRGESGQ